jgi:ABC-2 type transport system permease protein
VGARRTWGLGALSVAAGLLALVILARAAADVRLDRYAEIAESLVIPTVVAFVALVLGATAVGDEREERTILYFAATPVARLRLVAEWVLAAWAASLLVLAPAVAGTATLGLAAGMGARGLVWLVVAVAASALAYTALAALLALLIRRAIIVGMLYIVLWEATVATFAKSADKLSLGAYGRRLVAAGVPDAETFRVPDVSAWVALLVLVATSALAVWLGSRRLARMELP